MRSTINLIAILTLLITPQYMMAQTGFDWQGASRMSGFIARK